MSSSFAADSDGSDSDHDERTPPTSSRLPQPPTPHHPPYHNSYLDLLPLNPLPPSSPAPSTPSTPNRPHQPPRLPSPRLFRAWFSAAGSSPRQINLPFAPHDDTSQNVHRAFQSANRALRNAQEAFQAIRPINQGLAVDLTESSPNNSNQVPFEHATHPHDRPHGRRLNSNTLNEPVYPAPPLHPALAIQHPSIWSYLPRFHAIDPHSNFPALPDVNLLQEEEAIHRQRDNHLNWERTQARNRERNHIQQENMSRPSTSSSEMSSRTPRRTIPPVTIAEDPAIESVDLTEVDDSSSLTALLAKQRQDAILAQNNGNESGRTPLTAYKCPVCMETPTDATSTICGHVFCHRCIVDTLNWSIDQRRQEMPANRKPKGACPVCRKQLDLKDSGTGRHLVPLEIKLMVRLKRKREDPNDKGKGKANLSKAETLSDDDEPIALKRNKENVRAGKARRRETTEEALWGAFIEEPVSE